MISTRTKLLVGVAVLLVLGAVVTLALPPVGYNNGYSPTQPIPYDHSLHAGTYQMPCQYCHVTADKGRHATVPSLNICMNCHNAILPDSPFIQKIKEAYDNESRFEWNRVHLLPDFVMFSHARHVNKGVACQTCHGPVQEMKQVYQFTDLSMGWCVNCHRKNNAPTNCSSCHY